MNRPRRTRALSIHARLYLGFGAVLGVCAALMAAIVYVGMRFLPTYDLSRTVVAPPGSSFVQASPGAPADPSPRSSAPQLSPSRSPGIQPGSQTKYLGDISSKEDVWNTVLLVSLGGVLLVMAVGLGAGRLLSRRLLAPLHTISEAAAKAADGNLRDRIDAQGPEDELTRLADTFDTMLARLEESFAAHRRFAANASHELLTPLATTRAALQVVGDDPTGAEFAELAPMLRETNERNISVVRALLDLAGADHAPFDPDPVDLAELAELAAAERSERAAALGIRLDVDTEPDHEGYQGYEATGNATLLRQLVLNLLDNGLAHNVPENGTVHLSVFRERATAVVVEVENTGPQVDEAVVDRLFEPFYRVRARVGSDRSGHGLGLAIVRSIASAHHGTATASANRRGGLTVRVEIPAPQVGRRRLPQERP
ncbi:MULTISPECIES: HAMP domain-containing sensor histidine kinase [unclassified Streptomyces]|uniref:sensor histidine kinase n=1 Tax=unclassified Streptomyces TaxID=2593676 RepID=UPI0033C74A82